MASESELGSDASQSVSLLSLSRVAICELDMPLRGGKGDVVCGWQKEAASHGIPTQISGLLKTASQSWSMTMENCNLRKDCIFPSSDLTALLMVLR